MSYRFFLSYSSKNLEPSLKRFCRDLTTYVRERVGGEAADTSFRDQLSMKTGSDWPSGLLNALTTSQVLVYVLSIDYMQCDFCGREYQAFVQRLSRFKAMYPDRPVPSSILPVVWVPPAPGVQFPPLIARQQAADEDFPSEYRRVGLKSLATKSDKSHYRECIKVLGQRILASAHGDPLPPLEDCGSVHDLPNAFLHHTGAGAVECHQPAGSSKGNPTEVKYLCIAASKSDMRDLVTQATYSEPIGREHDDGWYWEPYNPPESIAVGRVVNQLLSDYRCEPVRLQSDVTRTIGDLRAAADRNDIVLLIADVWSVLSHRYTEFFRRFDTEIPWNHAVLIPWNERDPHTMAAQEQLDANLRLVFRSKYTSATRFRARIRSLPDFRVELRSVLDVLRSEIESHRAARMQILGPPLPQIRIATEVRNV